MSSPIIKDLPELIDNNIISADAAKAIADYYATKKEPASTQLIIFGALGAILVGLGIILIFAHNWDNFSRLQKTALALFPLLLFQCLAGYSLVKDKNRLWKEVTGTLLFFSVGAAIALVSQVYNIPGEQSSYILTWTLLCFPLMYILKSNTLAILHLVFSTFYAFDAGYFNPVSPWMYLALTAGFIPYYLHQLKQFPGSYGVSVFNWLLPVSLTIALGGFISGADEFGFVIYMAFLCLLYNIGLLPYFTAQEHGWNGFLNLGRTGIALLLLATSFRWFWKATIAGENPEHEFVLVWIAFFAAAIYFAYRSIKNKFRPDLYQLTLVIFPALYLLGSFNDHAATILNNILVLGLGVVSIREGASKFNFGMLNFGLIVISGLIISRFFDTNMSFAVRGLLFIAVGAGFFMANYMVIQKKKKIPANTQEP